MYTHDNIHIHKNKQKQNEETRSWPWLPRSFRDHAVKVTKSINNTFFFSRLRFHILPTTIVNSVAPFFFLFSLGDFPLVWHCYCHRSGCLEYLSLCENLALFTFPTLVTIEPNVALVKSQHRFFGLFLYRLSILSFSCLFSSSSYLPSIYFMSDSHWKVTEPQ